MQNSDWYKSNLEKFLTTRFFHQLTVKLIELHVSNLQLNVLNEDEGTCIILISNLLLQL